MHKKIRETEYQGSKERIPYKEGVKDQGWMDRWTDGSICLSTYLLTYLHTYLPIYLMWADTTTSTKTPKQKQKKRRHGGKKVNTQHLPFVRPCAKRFHITYVKSSQKGYFLTGGFQVPFEFYKTDEDSLRKTQISVFTDKKVKL